MNIELLETEPTPYLVKEYPNDDDLQTEKLTEVYIVVYTMERKGRDPEEYYTFTTDFEQAYKRFKLLPNTQGLLKRLLTDDDTLIKLAIEGTRPKVSDDDPRLKERCDFNERCNLTDEVLALVGVDDEDEFCVKCGGTCDGVHSSVVEQLAETEKQELLEQLMENATISN